MAREFNNLRIVIYILFLSVILFGQIHIPTNFWNNVFDIDNPYQTKKASLNSGKYPVNSLLDGGGKYMEDSLSIRTILKKVPASTNPYSKY